MWRRAILAVAALLFLLGCTSVPKEFKPYRACVKRTTRTGNTQWDSGTVMETFLSDGVRHFLFLDDDNAKDLRQLEDVTTGVMPCPMSSPFSAGFSSPMDMSGRRN